MNKEDYYTTRTDRQRISELQRKVMRLETEIKELDTFYTKENEKLKEQLKYMDIAQVRLTKDFLSQIKEQSREQTPMHMLQTLETCYSILDGTVAIHVLKDLRNVIKFLQK